VESTELRLSLAVFTDRVLRAILPGKRPLSFLTDLATVFERMADWCNAILAL
jgi:hypothetical protein